MGAIPRMARGVAPGEGRIVKFHGSRSPLMLMVWLNVSERAVPPEVDSTVNGWLSTVAVATTEEEP